MNFDLSHLVALFESRIGRRATTILAWLLFLVVLGWAAKFLITDIVIPLERFFGGTGNLRADLISKEGAPFWPALIATLAILGGSVILFLPFMNLLMRGRRVPQSALDDLEEKRSWAIHNVYNFPVANDAQLEEWRSRNNQFVSEVTEILENHFSRADILRFTRLGVIPGLNFGFASLPEHIRELQMFAKRLDTLEKIADRYSAR